MIEHDAFVNEMHALADRFNRQVSEEMVQRYYDFLSPRMATSEFRRAASVIYAHDQFWPPPVRFLQAVGKDPASEAEAEWEVVLDVVRSGGGLRPSEQRAPLEAALRAVGGTTTLGHTNEDRLPWIKREFVAAYKAHAEHATPELPS